MTNITAIKNHITAIQNVIIGIRNDIIAIMTTRNAVRNGLETREIQQKWLKTNGLDQ